MVGACSGPLWGRRPQRCLRCGSCLRWLSLERRAEGDELRHALAAGSRRSPGSAKPYVSAAIGSRPDAAVRRWTPTALARMLSLIEADGADVY